MESTEKDRSRSSIPVEKKVQIIRSIEAGEKQVHVAAKFGVKQCTVSSIYSNKAKFLAEWEAGGGSRVHISVGKPVRCRNCSNA